MTHGQDRLRLDGRVALVTGATRGIGLACAQVLAARGAKVVVVGRGEIDGLAAAESVGGTYMAGDVGDPGTPARLAAHVEARFGRLDVLVNNAGGLGAVQGVLDTTEEAFDATFAVHLKAPWFLMSRLAPLMPRGGSIINVASIAGHRVGASSAAYSVAKAALLHLTRHAAAELGSRGIRVNSVSPGFIPTGIHAQALAPDDPRADWFLDSLGRVFRQRQALDHGGTPGDVAEIVAFLASDASAFVSGTDVVVDGGTIWGRSSLL